jgi:nucleoid DNA-binding protein
MRRHTFHEISKGSGLISIHPSNTDPRKEHQMAGITDVAKQAGISEEAVKNVFGAMKKLTDKGEQVQIRGFGTFKVKTRAARVSQNPRTQEPVNVPAKNVLTFKPSK